LVFSKNRNKAKRSETFYYWKSKYSGMEVSQLKRVKELELELAQYKKIVAEQTLHITVLKDIVEKKL
jgi:putative transposase